MRNQTSGHLLNHGTIRGHSVGEIYPYVIRITGSWNDGFRYQIIGGGLLPIDWPSYEQAHKVAVAIVKAERV